MHKIFGKREYESYYDRPGAYLLPIRDGKVAVVKVKDKDYFLLGGGSEKQESDAECICRECREEIGFTVSIGEKIGSAEMFCVVEEVGPFHPMQTYYRGELVKQEYTPVETDHQLVWLPVEFAQGHMFTEMQGWAIGEAVKAAAKA